MGHASAHEPVEQPPAPPAGAPPAAQEKDLWWGSFAARTLLPSFIVCGVLTLVIPAEALYLWWFDRQNPALMRHSAYLLVGAVWLVQLLRLAYRLLTYTYRLTTRRLLCERSLVHFPSRQVELARVRSVTVEQTALERLAGVGRVCVQPDGDEPALVLAGVHRADTVAARVRKAAQMTRHAEA